MQNSDNLKIEHLSVLMMDMFDFVSETNPTYQDFRDKFGQYPDDKFMMMVDALTSMNMICFDKTTDRYSIEVTPIIGEQVILDGETNLPVTVIELPQENKKLISRGTWYELPLDFDIRRIKWNAVLYRDKDGKEVHLTDYLKTVALKEKKSKIKHNPEYDMLRNKVVPYCDMFKLMLNSIGDEVTEVTIIFQQSIKSNTDKFTGLRVNTTISTKQLLAALDVPKEERNWEELVNINRLYSVNDFITAKNEILLADEDGEITYARITGIRKGFEITLFRQTRNGIQSKLDMEEYYTYEDLQARIREILELDVNQDFLNACEIWIE